MNPFNNSFTEKFGYINQIQKYIFCHGRLYELVDVGLKKDFKKTYY